jgi:hypothetical protein
MTIIHSGARAPSETSKKAIRSTISRHCNHIHSFAYVVEGRGFGAAAMRSALSLISLAARYPFPQKVFATVAEGQDWIVSRTPEGAPGIMSNGLILVADRMRAEVRRLATAVAV